MCAGFRRWQLFQRLSIPRVAVSTGGLLTLAGCFNWSSLKSSPPGDVAEVDGDVAVVAENVDPFVADPATGEQKFLDAVKPFVLAISKRDYTSAFGMLSPTAKERFSRNQFIPTDDEQLYAKHEAEPILKPTADQFVELMREVEAIYGTPDRFDPPIVETDPDVLSRKDPLASYDLGAMPDTIPIEHRQAAVQTWIFTRLSEQQLQQAAEDDGIAIEEYRKLEAEAAESGEGRYFKLKTVLIDDGGGLVIGYFEIAPRSIWD